MSEMNLSEMEGLGMVALIGALLVPGAIWIAKGKSTASMVGRTVLIGGLIAAAVTMELAIDETTEELAK
jgi:hypothetical protein